MESTRNIRFYTGGQMERGKSGGNGAAGISRPVDNGKSFRLDRKNWERAPRFGAPRGISWSVTKKNHSQVNRRLKPKMDKKKTFCDIPMCQGNTC